MTVLVLILISLQFVSGQNYELVILDFDQKTESGAYSVNSSGFTVGYKFIEDNAKPYLWSPSRGYMELGTPDSTIPNGSAYAINDLFDVVGTFGSVIDKPYRINNGVATTWIFDPNSNDFITSTIGTRPSQARAINNNGDVAGSEGSGNYGYIRDIYTMNGYNVPMTLSYCYSINEQGNAVGTHYSYYSRTFAPLYVKKETNGTRTLISGDVIFQAYPSSGGFKINNNNQVVGVTAGSSFYWEPENGSFTVFSQGIQFYSINNNGFIVGTSNGLAHIWKKVGNQFEATDLNKLKGSSNEFILEKAYDINDKGQIVGQGIGTNGIRSAFMLTPSTPAPRMLALLPDRQIEFTWQTKADHVYSFRFSEDLKYWFSYPDLYLADSTTNISVFFPTDEFEKIFIDIRDLTPE